MPWPCRKFVGKSWPLSVLDSTAKRIAFAEAALERAGSERTRDRWRRQIERLRAVRASVLETKWEALVGRG